MSECKGIDLLISVNTGTIAVPVWKVVGGQRNATLNRSTDEIDLTTKSSGGWHKGAPSVKNWSVDADGVLIKNDEAYEALLNSWRNDEQVNLKVVRANGITETGMATITDFPEEGPYDGEATYSMSFVGSGPLAEPV